MGLQAAFVQTDSVHLSQQMILRFQRINHIQTAVLFTDISGLPCLKLLPHRQKQAMRTQCFSMCSDEP